MVSPRKYVPRRLRSILRPAWRLFRAAIGRPAQGPTWPPARSGPIRAMTAADFRQVRGHSRYYRKRARYLSVAARECDDLITRRGLRTALELGPHLRPVVTGADVIELRPPPDLEGAGRLIVHDARQTPWPIEDRAYDLFVGLQVFEHLGTAQPEAFLEVRRVARHAVISLPIDWVMKDPTNSHHQLSRERALSWFAPVEPTRIVEGNPGPGMRLVFVFEDLQVP